MTRSYQKRQKNRRDLHALKMVKGVLAIMAEDAKEKNLTADEIIEQLFECEEHMKELIKDVDAEMNKGWRKA